MQRPNPLWFPPKRYGWGWGLPNTWQGWVVLALYFVAVVAIFILYPPSTGGLRFAALIVIASAVLTLVCWLTGAPPRWSWGEKRDDDG